jgi:hypothetical protein
VIVFMHHREARLKVHRGQHIGPFVDALWMLCHRTLGAGLDADPASSAHCGPRSTALMEEAMMNIAHTLLSACAR